jgi:adenylylsulfate kinase-like enzyme
VDRNSIASMQSKKGNLIFKQGLEEKDEVKNESGVQNFHYDTPRNASIHVESKQDDNEEVVIDPQSVVNLGNVSSRNRNTIVNAALAFESHEV